MLSSLIEHCAGNFNLLSGTNLRQPSTYLATTPSNILISHHDGIAYQCSH